MTARLLTTARLFTTALASASLVLGSSPAMAGEKRYGLTSFERIVLKGDFAVEVTTRGPGQRSGDGRSRCARPARTCQC